jgi:hypothetical protein
VSYGSTAVHVLALQLYHGTATAVYVHVDSSDQLLFSDESSRARGGDLCSVLQDLCYDLTLFLQIGRCHRTGSSRSAELAKPAPHWAVADPVVGTYDTSDPAVQLYYD